MSEDRRIVVEIVSHADVSRLEKSDQDLKSELDQLRQEVEGLRRQLFDFMAVFSELKRKLRG